MCVCICGLSSQIVFTFHLAGSLSIQLFICISAEGMCKLLACVSVCLCAATAKVRRQAARCVKGCRGNVQTPVSGGLCVKYRC